LDVGTEKNCVPHRKLTRKISFLPHKSPQYTFRAHQAFPFMELLTRNRLVQLSRLSDLQLRSYGFESRRIQEKNTDFESHSHVIFHAKSNGATLNTISRLRSYRFDSFLCQWGTLRLKNNEQYEHPVGKTWLKTEWSGEHRAGREREVNMVSTYFKPHRTYDNNVYLRLCGELQGMLKTSISATCIV
jgi:hypothetical protein